MGTLIALRRPAMRAKPNPLARPQSLFCSAFVTHVLRKAGLDPVPGLDVKHTAPEDLFRSPRVTGIWLLQPPPAGEGSAEGAHRGALEKAAGAVAARVR